jgi:hypothetical protein
MVKMTDSFKKEVRQKISDTIDAISFDYEHDGRKVYENTGLTGTIENRFHGEIFIPFQTAWSTGLYPKQFSEKFNEAVRNIEKDVISILSDEYPEIKDKNVTGYRDLEKLANREPAYKEVLDKYEDLELQFGEQDLIIILVEVNFMCKDRCRINGVVRRNTCARYLPKKGVNVHHNNIEYENVDEDTFLDNLSDQLMQIENKLIRG